MPPMDISDVAYDQFLINGQSENELYSRRGDTVLLRIINAGASSYFYLNYAGGDMTVIAADGVDVVPFETSKLLIGIGETYDLLVGTSLKQKSLEFRATAQDGSGYASAFLGKGKKVFADLVPRPNLYLPMRHGDHHGMHGHDHHSMVMDENRPGTPYDLLKAKQKTALDASRPLKTFHLQLTGDMERYVWAMNGKTLSEADVIKIRKGQRVQFILENKTMMHHPMHLHGHFFRVLNQHGEYSPLKHTVDVPPMGSRTIEFAADEEHDWFFHCHVLYHMKSGMTRIVRYEDTGPRKYFRREKLMKDPFYFWADATVLLQMSDGEIVASNTRNTLKAEWEVGWEDEEEEYRVLYERYQNRFFSPIAGWQYEEENSVGIFGFHYLLPMLVESTSWVDTDGDVRVILEKTPHIVDRFFLPLEVEYDSDEGWEGEVGVEWMFAKRASFITRWHSEFGWGGGIKLIF